VVARHVAPSPPAPLPQAGKGSSHTLRAHLKFLAASSLALLVLLTLLRLLLLGFNHALIGDTPTTSLLAAFVNGARFDLRLIVYLCLPLVLALLCPPLMQRRGWQRAWLAGCASLVSLLGVIELNFYQEFQQRLNALVFQYLREDPQTVLSMLWHGFPVLRLLALWLAFSVVCWTGFSWLARNVQAPPPASTSRLPQPARHAVAFLCCALVCVLAARGTLRQGPPLRWGDAYTTGSVFANQLGLNGALSLYNAAKARWSGSRKIHRDSMPMDEAWALTRALLVAPHEQPVDTDTAAVRRIATPPGTRQPSQLPVRHVIVILMESFAGPFIGALGSTANITPHFDQLAEEGLLFRRFFSNGTHTHQGLFASMACFPNLPGFEYLMQMPEGAQGFSGLPQLLSPRGYDNLYVYNGDFAWDNQEGFFRNQGMTRFIGRHDYVNPVVSDPTWGVSDQDMFERAAQELRQFDGSHPFYALLQTLSNHTPYALPDELPVEPVTGHGALDQHLTAMRYADWALGRFFTQIRSAPWFDETLFVLIGDHGFGVPTQLTDINLLRFHVPMLLIAPGIRARFGAVNDTVGSQVDMVPTIMGRLGGGRDGTTQHQCWGRDLLNLSEADAGFAVIKPSGNDQTVALVSNDQILVQPQGLPARLYRYQLGTDAQATVLTDTDTDTLARQLAAYLQSATRSLLNHTAGAQAAASEIP